MRGFNEGDVVIHQKGNIPRIGVIIRDPDRHYFWSHLQNEDGNIIKTELADDPPLAFYSEEQNYFEWLRNAAPYLKHVQRDDSNKEGNSTEEKN